MNKAPKQDLRERRKKRGQLAVETQPLLWHNNIMKSFIHPDFMLQNDAGRELYHTYAEGQPIFDYHCHLPPDQLAEDKVFPNLYSIWLAGDHYKWRAMRSNGVPEAYCTGDASDYDKFLAFARTVPNTLGNPLYHWTHMELSTYFGIHELLCEQTAPAIWEAANKRLSSLSVQTILKGADVRVVCTTDDPADNLEHHLALKKSGLSTKVLPTFRPDKAMQVRSGASFKAWISRLESVYGSPITSLQQLIDVLESRYAFFHEVGCRLSDHGLKFIPAESCTLNQAVAIFSKANVGLDCTQEDENRFTSFLLRHIGKWNAQRNWTMQLHLGALRNNNSRLFKQLGADTGFDSIGDWNQAESLAAFLNALDETNQLPRTILYNLNPSQNYVFATMIGNFQDGSIPGKIQYGSGWWFLDQKEAMEWQLRSLANLGLLSRFVGMLTDSRSFLSYVRHDYFRRILCNLLGSDIERGEIPHDMNLVGGMVRNICFKNAKDYFGIEL